MTHTQGYRRGLPNSVVQELDQAVDTWRQAQGRRRRDHLHGLVREAATLIYDLPAKWDFHPEWLRQKLGIGRRLWSAVSAVLSKVGLLRLDLTRDHEGCLRSVWKVIRPVIPAHKPRSHRVHTTDSRYSDSLDSPQDSKISRRWNQANQTPTPVPPPVAVVLPTQADRRKASPADMAAVRKALAGARR